MSLIEEDKPSELFKHRPSNLGTTIYRVGFIYNHPPHVLHATPRHSTPDYCTPNVVPLNTVTVAVIKQAIFGNSRILLLLLHIIIYKHYNNIMEDARRGRV